MDYFFKEDIIEYLFDKIKLLIIPSENNNYKSKFLQSRALLCCVIFLLVVKIFTTLISINFPQNIFFADITKSALEAFVNQARQSQGLQPLADNQKLDQAAALKAENMVQNQYFDHTSPSGVTPWFWFLKAGYNYKYAGENLAAGFYESQEVYNAWLNSPAHKANILNPNYKEVGTAVLKGLGQNDAIVVVQEFGAQLPALAAKNNNPKPVITHPLPETSAPIKNIAPADNNEKVLSQSTQAQTYIEPSKGKSGTNNLVSKLANSLIYDYSNLLQKVIYGVSLVVIGALLTLIFFNFRIVFKKELVFRALIVVALLSTATLLNTEAIVALIPHQILI